MKTRLKHSTIKLLTIGDAGWGPMMTSHQASGLTLFPSAIHEEISVWINPLTVGRQGNMFDNFCTFYQFTYLSLLLWSPSIIQQQSHLSPRVAVTLSMTKTMAVKSSILVSARSISTSQNPHQCCNTKARNKSKHKIIKWTDIWGKQLPQKLLTCRRNQFHWQPECLQQVNSWAISW